MATAKYMGDHNGEHVRMSTCPNCEQRVPRRTLGEHGMCTDCEEAEREHEAELVAQEHAAGLDLDLCEYNTADEWPEWMGIDECRCGASIEGMLQGGDTVPENCPTCGLWMQALVRHHCGHCHRVIVGWYVADEWGTAYCDRACAAAGDTDEVMAESGPDLYVVLS